MQSVATLQQGVRVEEGPIRKRFEKLDGDRTAYMDRLRKYAKLTIPRVLPEPSTAPGDPMERSHQSLGAKGLTNLVSKMHLALFPPHQSMFLFRTSPKAKANPDVDPAALTAFENILYARELQVESMFQSTAFRFKMRPVLEQTVALGTGMFQITDDIAFKTFRLDQYVIRRGADAELLEIVVKEWKDPAQIPDWLHDAADLKDEHLESDSPRDVPALHLYTRATLQQDKTWLIVQEMNGREVARSVEKHNPYVVVGFIEMPGEDYSRGLIEEAEGDLETFNVLCYALGEAAVNAAQVNVVLDSNSLLRPMDFEKHSGRVIPNGKVTGGKVADAAVFSLDKYPDMTFARQTADDIQKRLHPVFLMEREMQPSGERVTATQVIRIAREIEGATGGVYSNIAEELQRPTVARVVHLMDRKSMLTPLPPGTDEAAETVIVTGVDALGREADMERLVGAVQVLAQIPESLQRIRMNVLIDRIFQGYNIDTQLLLKTVEEMQAEAQAREQAQVRMMAAQQAIQTQGAIAEAGAAQPPAATA